MVKINVTGLHLEVTDALNAHSQEQFGAIVSKFENFIVEDITLTLDVSTHHSHIQTATVIVPVKGNDLVIEETGDDMYQVITSLAGKVSRGVRRIKDKATNKKGLNKRVFEDNSTSDELYEE